MTPESEPVRVECWCRSLAQTPNGPQAAVVERLEWLATDGVLDELTIETWPAAVPADPAWTLGEHERRIHERLDTFECWAARADCELRGGFGDRRVGNVYTHPAVEEVRVLPVVALAEYHDGELTAVSPVLEDGDVFGVQDHLEAISKGQESRNRALLTAGD